MLCRLSYLGVEGKPYPTSPVPRQPVPASTGQAPWTKWYPFGYHWVMFAATSLRNCRHRSGYTLRALADRADTSHSALAAYEAGRKVPSSATLERILRAAGYELEVRAVKVPVPMGGVERGQELEEVLELAAMFPTRHDPVLRAPIFGHR